MMQEQEKRTEDQELWEAVFRTKAYKRESERFLPEVVEIQAVVGACGFSGGKAGKEKLWSASVELTAWKDEKSGEIYKGEFLLGTAADDRLLHLLQEQVKADSIIRAKVRIDEDKKRFLLLESVQAGDDPSLKEILKEQIQEVAMEVEGLGRFLLDRSVNWFAAAVEWMGKEVELTFDQEEEEVMEHAIRTAKALMADQAGWDRRIREYAADELLELANEWAAEDTNEEMVEVLDEMGELLVSRKQFMERMELETINVLEDEEFEFWFRDGDMFWGHSIRVSGSLSGRLDGAHIEG